MSDLMAWVAEHRPDIFNRDELWTGSGSVVLNAATGLDIDPATTPAVEACQQWLSALQAQKARA